MLASLTVVILTYNEEIHIARCLAAIAGFARRIVVVDSFSRDRTVELARQHGADVLQNRFVNYAHQFQWALDNAGIDTEWVMRLDADEVVEPDLGAEIETRLDALPADVAGINIKRKHIAFNRWIRHGGRYPLVLLRLWRNGKGRIEQRWMDEHMIVEGGDIVSFSGGLADHNLNNLTFFTDKHNKYATREAVDILGQKYALFVRDTALSQTSTSLQASLKRQLKERLYNFLPIWAGPAGYFLYRYIFQLGFLDGRPGLVYHVLQGFWYRFLVAAKVYELERGLAGARGREAKRLRLRQLTGLEI